MPELEDLGPAARSWYDDSSRDDRHRRDRSHHRDSSIRPKDTRHGKSGSGTTGKGPRCSESGSGKSDPKSKPMSESLGAKLAARKEYKEHYKKVVENSLEYLEERQHQILPEEHQAEIASLRFFGAGAERAAIEILALIDWAAEYVELSRSPVPEIPGFLRRPFVKGKPVMHLIPDDPTEFILKEKCVRTKAQKAWTYLCALLQFWTDEATTASGEVLYGGRRHPANPMIARIRAVLNPSFGKHLEITWASIAASTSWTQARLFFGTPDMERFRTEPSLTADLRNPLENAVEERWERYLKEGKQEMPDLGFSTASWASADSNSPPLLSGQLEVQHPTEAESVPPGFTRLD